MTRKTLSLLVITPVFLFALDKGFHAGGGQKKEHKAKKQAEKPAPVQMEVTGLGTGTGTGTGTAGTALSQAEKKEAVKQLKETFASSEAMETFWTLDLLWASHENIDEATQALLTKVQDKLEAENPATINLRSFSRCPSGYRVMIVSSGESQPTTEGYLCFDRGCDQQPLAKFKYETATETVQVSLGEGKGYVSLDEFIELYKHV